MLATAERQRADIVIGGWAFHTERTKRVCIKDTTMSKRILAEGDEALLLYTKSQGREHSYYVLWNKIYRRELILGCAEKIKLLDPPKLCFSEDALLNFFCFKYAERITNVNSGFYFYRIHENQSVVADGTDTLKKQIDSMSYTLSIMNDNINNNIYKSEIRNNVAEWSRLMARTHYTTAKSLGAAELFDYVKEKYHVRKNRKSTLRDAAVYTRSELLGENFDEIDSALSKIYFSRKRIAARYERRAKCISRIIADMPNRAVYSRCGEIIVPRRRIPPKDLIFHNSLIYKLSMLIFKKGSRARAFLKRKL
jgi:hypothetical protein